MSGREGQPSHHKDSPFQWAEKSVKVEGHGSDKKQTNNRKKNNSTEVEVGIGNVSIFL